MAKQKLLEDILHNPSRYYRMPGDVPRDRRFADEERIMILKAWQDQAGDRADEIGAVLAELEGRSIHHAAQ